MRSVVRGLNNSVQKRHKFQSISLLQSASLALKFVTALVATSYWVAICNADSARLLLYPAASVSVPTAPTMTRDSPSLDEVHSRWGVTTPVGEQDAKTRFHM